MVRMMQRSSATMSNMYVKDALLRVKGVGDIFSRGDDFSMRIWFNPEKLLHWVLRPAEVNAALQEQNLQVAAGLLVVIRNHCANF